MDKNAICHISTVHQLYDDRIFYKECLSLAESGRKVFLVVQHDRPENINGIEIVPLPEFSSRIRRFFSGGKKAFSAAIRTRAAVCHFHDPELLLIGVLLRIAGRKVIYDVHENYSQQILYKEWIAAKWIRFLVARCFRLTELISCLFFNAVITVTEDIRDRFPAKKTVLLRNFPVLPDLSRCVPAGKPEGKIILIYTGGLSRVRGIKELVNAMDLLDERYVLWLIGAFDSSGYQTECEQSAGWNQVCYYGYKRHDEVYNYVMSADIGISLLYPIRNYLTSLPVKVFEYMAMKKPVVMSDFIYWQKYFADCARFTSPMDPRRIAETIHSLASDSDSMMKLGNAGYDKIMNDFSWNKEKEVLFRIYDKILCK